MNGSDLTAILPLILLGGAITIVMLAIVFVPQSPADRAALRARPRPLSHRDLASEQPWLARQVTPLFVIDRYALFCTWG